MNKITTKALMIIYYIIVMVVILVLTILGLVLLTPERPDTVGYDCRWAEYPHAIDVPKAYIEACRESKR